MPSFLTVLVTQSFTKNLFLLYFIFAAFLLKIKFLNASVLHLLHLCITQSNLGKYPLYSHILLSMASPTSLGMPDKYFDASQSTFSKFWHHSQQLFLKGIQPWRFTAFGLWQQYVAVEIFQVVL